MKKILSTLLVASIGIVRSFAQDADLQSWIYIDTFNNPWADTVDRTNTTTVNINNGQTFSPSFAYAVPTGATVDSLFGVWGFRNNGPDAIDATDRVTFLSSFQPKGFLTQQECIDEGVPFSDTARYYWSYSRLVNATVEAGSDFGLSSYFDVDSIKLLIDWTKWVDSGRFVMVGPPFENFQTGTTYGLFLRCFGLNDSQTPSNTDANMRNNIYVQKVVWNGGGVGLKDFTNKLKRENLVIYPNPAQNVIKFDYDFKVNTNAMLAIRDVTGKVIKTTNFGRQTAGTRTFSYDVSGLASGNYTVEFVTGETSAVSKLIIK